jgi:hypothetical protein
MAFTEKLDAATSGQFQATTDGFPPYFDAIHNCLGTRGDFARLIKVYAAPADDEHRYSPARVVEAIAKPEWGQADVYRICTSHVERQNLTMRMQIRRLTRLTNAFSKKAGQLVGRACSILCLVQFLPNAPDDPMYSGDGSEDHRSHLDAGGTFGSDREIDIWSTKAKKK